MPIFTISRRQILVAAAVSVGPVRSVHTSPSRTLRMGHQKGWLSVLRNRGDLEKRLAPMGVNVTWTEFSTGPVQLEALKAGAIDLGDVGETPPIFSQAAGTPLVYAAATIPRPRLEALITPQNSSIHTVADLKGKRIALNKGSNVHYFLVKLLEKNGLEYHDVIPVFLPPDQARSAFEKNEVDAWAIWDPFLAWAQTNLQARQLSDGTGLVKNRQFYVTTRQFCSANPDILRVALQEIKTIDAWIGANQSLASTELTTVLKLDQPVIALYLSRGGYGVVPVSSSILAEQQVIADSFLRLKLIPQKIELRHAALI
jgi:sulfonate transport system substrate-binding protein